MNMPLRYEDSLAAKVAMAPVSGFLATEDEVNPLLKPQFERWHGMIREAADVS